MSLGARLRPILEVAQLVSLDGPFHRFVAFKHLYAVPDRPQLKPEILSGRWAKEYGGRYTPTGAFRTTYLSADPVTALGEAEARFDGDLPGPPYVHVTIQGQLGGLLDLTDDAILKELGLTLDDLQVPWAAVEAEGMEPVTHRLARALYLMRSIEGLLYYSSAVPFGVNIAVFPERLRPESWLAVHDPDGLLSERIPEKPRI